MLENMYLSPWNRPREVHTTMFYNKVTIKRRVLSNTKGAFGEPQYTYATIVAGWPCAISDVNSHTSEYLPAGQTEIASYILDCKYWRQHDGGLIVRERDIVIDQETGAMYEVLWSHDPSNTKVQITATMREGTLNAANLAEQV